MTDVDSKEIEFQCLSCGDDLKQTMARLANVEAPGEGILGKGDEETTGFTDYGIECLKQIIQVKKTRRPAGERRDNFGEYAEAE